MSSYEMFERSVTGAPSEFTEATGVTYAEMTPEARATIDTWLQRVLPRVEFEVADVESDEVPDTEDDEPVSLDDLEVGDDEDGGYDDDYDEYEEEAGEDTVIGHDGREYTRDQAREAFYRQYKVHDEDTFYRRLGIDPSWVHEDEEEEETDESSEFGGFGDADIADFGAFDLGDLPEADAPTYEVQVYDYNNVPEMVYSDRLQRSFRYADLVASFNSVPPEDRIYDDMDAWLRYEYGISFNY